MGGVSSYLFVLKKAVSLMVFNLKRAMGAFKVPFDYDKRYVILVPQ